MPPPAALARYYGQSPAFREGLTPEERAAIDRLLTRQDMDPVWDAVVSDPNDDYLPDLFFQCCVYSRRRWSGLSKIPTKELEGHLGRIADRAESVARLLVDRQQEIELVVVWPLTVERLLREEFPDHWHQLANGVQRPDPAAYTREALPAQIPGSTAPENHQVDDDDDEAAAARLEIWLQENPPDEEPLGEIPIDVFLTRLASRLRRHVVSTDAIVRPTKPNDTHAERTFLARELTRFFLTHGGQPRYELVARTVSAILDLDPPLDADLVTKNVRDLAKEKVINEDGDTEIRDAHWDSAEDYGRPPEE